MRFQDHFSGVSPAYARYRPRYPEALFDALRAAAPRGVLAWDAATGSGQAAAALVGRFARVVASDAAVSQLARARIAPRLAYVAATCEEAPLAAGTVDLVTVGQALHWLDLDRFYGEVRRVLSPGGVVAAWTYSLFTVDPAVDRVVRRFHDEDVGPYWPDSRRHVERGYRDIPFPFARLDLPPVEMEADWERERALGYIATWSAVDRYRRAMGEDPVPGLRNELQALWPADETRRLRWRLTVLAGRPRPPATIDG